jgi:phage terminase large subunit GpA-like protein
LRDGEIILPERSLVLTAAADIQKDRIEAEIVAWGLDGERWGIQCRVFRGNTSTPELFNEFDQWILKKWKHPSGYLLSPACVTLDSGNLPSEVYAYSFRCSPRDVLAVKGVGGFDLPFVIRSQGRNQRLYLVKGAVAKADIYSKLRLTEWGPGFHHYPSNPQCGYDQTYFQQLCSESMRRTWTNGRPAITFELTSGSRNEALDVAVYNAAALDILYVNWESVQAMLAKPNPNDWRPKQPVPIVAQLPEVVTPVHRQPTRRRATGWAKPC